MGSRIVTSAAMAASALLATVVYLGFRALSRPSKRMDPEEDLKAFRGVYIEKSGRFIVCTAKENTVKRHRISWNSTLGRATVVNWDVVVPAFDVWEQADIFKFEIALRAVCGTLEISRFPRHCTFVVPPSVTDAQKDVMATAADNVQNYYIPVQDAISRSLDLSLTLSDAHLSLHNIIFPDNASILFSLKQCGTNLATTLASAGHLPNAVIQYIFLENDSIQDVFNTLPVLRESLDIIAHGASLHGMYTAGARPLWVTLGPIINISTSNGLHQVTGRHDKTREVLLTTVSDNQQSMEVFVYEDQQPLGTIVLEGLPLFPEGGLQVIFSVTYRRNMNGHGAGSVLLQLVEPKSKLRVHRVYTLGIEQGAFRDVVPQVALLLTHGTSLLE